jgi:hypothetical protein
MRPDRIRKGGWRIRWTPFLNLNRSRGLKSLRAATRHDDYFLSQTSTLQFFSGPGISTLQPDRHRRQRSSPSGVSDSTIPGN